MENKETLPSQKKFADISFRTLNKNDKIALDHLIEEIESCLPDKQWFLPILKTAYDHFFDEEWTLFCGAFYKDKLIGASALFFNPFEYSQSVEQIHLSNDHIAEIGRCMVSPAFRGKNLMFCMNKFLLETNTKYVEYFVATAHPENIPSIKSLESLGFEKKGAFIKSGFQRNIYVMKA